ncbi:hypothetical protein ABH289_08440 [Acinetobacter pittii]|uniref:hypothetical protein n=1 Tax=Acinetobacter calcoaceticus/baumannii complex TaxID=909768 RepID=UPI003260514B
MALNSYLIGYDLNRPGQNYSGLHEKIKEISNGYWHNLDSAWIIKHTGPSTSIRDALLPYIDKNDELLVVLLNREAAWNGFSKTASDWLINYL